MAITSFEEGATTTVVPFVKKNVFPVLSTETGLGITLLNKSIASGEVGLELWQEIRLAMHAMLNKARNEWAILSELVIIHFGFYS